MSKVRSDFSLNSPIMSPFQSMTSEVAESIISAKKTVGGYSSYDVSVAIFRKLDGTGSLTGKFYTPSKN